MLCSKRFDMDGERDLFLAHLVMDHNVVIADVKHVPYFPGYVEEWRKMFKTLPLDVCPKIKTNYVAQSKSSMMGIEEIKESEEEDASAVTAAVIAAVIDEEKEEEEFSSPRGEVEEGDVARNTATLAPEKTEAELFGKDAPSATDAGGGGGEGGRQGAGDDEEEDGNGESTSSLNHLPEAGDAPALDVLKNAILERPALELEDPAIAAAHPAVPPLFKATENIKRLEQLSLGCSISYPAATTIVPLLLELTLSHGPYLSILSLFEDYTIILSAFKAISKFQHLSSVSYLFNHPIYHCDFSLTPPSLLPQSLQRGRLLCFLGVDVLLFLLFLFVAIDFSRGHDDGLSRRGLPLPPLRRHSAGLRPQAQAATQTPRVRAAASRSRKERRHFLKTLPVLQRLFRRLGRL